VCASVAGSIETSRVFELRHQNGVETLHPKSNSPQSDRRKTNKARTQTYAAGQRRLNCLLALLCVPSPERNFQPRLYLVVFFVVVRRSLCSGLRLLASIKEMKIKSYRSILFLCSQRVLGKRRGCWWAQKGIWYFI
jgi:hypothetical protein